MDNLGLLLWNYYKYKYLYKFKTREQLEIWQEKHIKSFVKRIVPKSKFYSKLYSDLNIENWQQLPTINKQAMMDNFDDLNISGIKKEEAISLAFEAERSRNFSPQINNISIGLSSGTSGNRGLFLVSKKERASWAGAILAKTLPTGILSNEKIAFFLRANSNLYETVNSKRICFKFFDLLNSIDKHIDDLNQYQPTIIVAPPSMLRILAQKINENLLTVNCRKIISVAEVLESIDKSFIEESFNQTVHQVYQATEGFLATTCKNGVLHLNEDIVCIQKEYIDEKSGRFIPIITDFSRKTQPIIRYRLNDILIEKKEGCTCSSCFTAIETIEGRTDDIFYLKLKEDGRLIEIFPDFIRREVIMTSSEILEYKINQSSTEQIKIYLKVKDKADKEKLINKLSNNLTILFKNFGCCVPQIEYIDSYEFIKGSKLRRVERNFNIE